VDFEKITFPSNSREKKKREMPRPRRLFRMDEKKRGGGGKKKGEKGSMANALNLLPAKKKKRGTRFFQLLYNCRFRGRGGKKKKKKGEKEGGAGDLR